MVVEKGYYRELDEEDYQRMAIPRRHWDADIDKVNDADLEVTSGGSMSPRSVAKSYVERIELVRKSGYGLLLYGNNGTGKTSMAVAISKEFRKRGYTVLFIEAASIKRYVVDKTRFDEVDSYWERALDVDMLIIDDVGKGGQDTKGFGARLLDELIRHRAANKRVTFLTTNASPRDEEVMEKIFLHSTISTMGECMLPVGVTGEDRREENKVKMSRTILG